MRRPASRALLGSGLGNGAGFFLPFLVARHFGISALTDAYAFALAVTVFGCNVASGVIETNVLPAAQRARSAGLLALAVFLRRTRVEALLASSMYIPVAVVGGAFLLARHGAASGDHHVAVLLIAELALLVSLVAVNSVSAAGLYARNTFFVPTATQLGRSALPLVALPFLGTGRAALVWIAALMVAGEGLRSTLLLLSLGRPRRTPLTGATKTGDLRVWRFAAPHALNMAVLSANPLIDRMVASSLPAGSVTTLDLAEKVFFVPTVAITSSILLVASARWSKSSLGEDPARLYCDYRRTLWRAMWISAALAVMVAVPVLVLQALGVLSESFAGRHAHVFAITTVVMLGALPFFAIAALGGRLMVATRRTAALPWFAVAIVATNAASDVVGAQVGGVVGIAGATVIAQALASASFTLYCHRLFGQSDRLFGQSEVAERGSIEGIPLHETAGLIQEAAK